MVQWSRCTYPEDACDLNVLGVSIARSTVDNPFQSVWCATQHRRGKIHRLTQSPSSRIWARLSSGNQLTLFQLIHLAWLCLFYRFQLFKICFPLNTYPGLQALAVGEPPSRTQWTSTSYKNASGVHRRRNFEVLALHLNTWHYHLVSVGANNQICVFKLDFQSQKHMLSRFEVLRLCNPHLEWTMEGRFVGELCWHYHSVQYRLHDWNVKFQRWWIP